MTRSLGRYHSPSESGRLPPVARSSTWYHPQRRLQTCTTEVGLAIDALDTLLHGYMSLAEHRRVVDDRIVVPPSSLVCLAIAMLLQVTSTAEDMRDNLSLLKQTMEDGLKHVRGSYGCTPVTQGCLIRLAIQLLIRAQSSLDRAVLRVDLGPHLSYSANT